MAARSRLTRGRTPIVEQTDIDTSRYTSRGLPVTPVKHEAKEGEQVDGVDLLSDVVRAPPGPVPVPNHQETRSIPLADHTARHPEPEQDEHLDHYQPNARSAHLAIPLSPFAR